MLLIRLLIMLSMKLVIQTILWIHCCHIYVFHIGLKTHKFIHTYCADVNLSDAGAWLNTAARFSWCATMCSSLRSESCGTETHLEKRNFWTVLNALVTSKSECCILGINSPRCSHNSTLNTAWYFALFLSLHSLSLLFFLPLFFHS